MAARVAGVLVLGVLGAASACRGSDGQGSRSATPVVGVELEAFSFVDPSGREIAWSPAEGLRASSEGNRTPDAVVVHVFQPDCPACRQQAGELERLRTQDPGRFAIVGIAHRLAAPDVKAFAEVTGAEYPLLTGTGSAWAQHWGRGDPTYIVDRRGAIAYAQVGFHPSDVERWQGVLEDLAADRVARYSGPERDALVVGEGLPVIELPPVDGKGSVRIALGEDGTLAVEQAGERRRFRAAIGFFSRYWDFSREEMVHLQKFHERYGNEGLFVFAISMESDREKARDWNRELGLTYTVLDGHGSELGERLAYG